MVDAINCCVKLTRLYIMKMDTDKTERKWIFGNEPTKNTGWAKYYSQGISSNIESTTYVVVNPESFKKTVDPIVDPIATNNNSNDIRFLKISCAFSISVFVCSSIIIIVTAIVLYLCLTGKCRR